MLIIQKNPNPSGAYPALQTWNMETPPNGYAVIADTVDMADFYAYNGFVTLIIEAIEHTREEEVCTIEETCYEDEVHGVDETYIIDTVTAYTPNVEAWEAWKASLPEPTEPNPSKLDQIEAQVAYTAMMTDTLLEV